MTSAKESQYNDGTTSVVCFAHLFASQCDHNPSLQLLQDFRRSDRVLMEVELRCFRSALDGDL
jgi:hypothetical protein